MGVVMPIGRVEAFRRNSASSRPSRQSVAAAAALAVLKVLYGEQLMANARATGDYLRCELKRAGIRTVSVRLILEIQNKRPENGCYGRGSARSANNPGGPCGLP